MLQYNIECEKERDAFSYMSRKKPKRNETPECDIIIHKCNDDIFITVIILI